MFGDMKWVRAFTDYIMRASVYIIRYLLLLDPLVSVMFCVICIGWIGLVRRGVMILWLIQGCNDLMEGLALHQRRPLILGLYIVYWEYLFATCGN
jgi:hypothetical protein